jgi:hypothetical protein
MAEGLENVFCPHSCVLMTTMLGFRVQDPGFRVRGLGFIAHRA